MSEATTPERPEETEITVPEDCRTCEKAYRCYPLYGHRSFDDCEKQKHLTHEDLRDEEVIIARYDMAGGTHFHASTWGRRIIARAFETIEHAESFIKRVNPHAKINRPDDTEKRPSFRQNDLFCKFCHSGYTVAPGGSYKDTPLVLWNDVFVCKECVVPFSKKIREMRSRGVE